MRLEIEIPPKEWIIRDGLEVALAGKGTSWGQSCLGRKAKEMGVYVIHHAGSIKYVGKTNGPAMSFATRLRREFQEGAASGKHVYPQLALLDVPPAIMVSLFSADDIKSLVRLVDGSLSSYQIIEIFETALIQVYLPDFQRHQEKRVSAQIEKLGYPRELLAALVKTNPGPRSNV